MDFRPFCSAVVWFEGVVICEGPRRRLGPGRGPWAEAAPPPLKKKLVHYGRTGENLWILNLSHTFKSAFQSLWLSENFENM